MTTYERIEKAILHAAESRGEGVTSDSLAAAAGLSRFHFHRLFTRWTGTTPKSFLRRLDAARAKPLLRRRAVLDAALESGLSGPGRLHDLMVTVDGVTPGQYKARGAGLHIAYAFVGTPFGPALAAAAPRGLCHLAFLRGPRAAALQDLRRAWPKAVLREDEKAVGALVARVFSRRGAPLAPSGTPFQLKVWEALLRIPEGKTATYEEVAAAVGKPKAVRAVGNAVGRNAVAYAIPCHRVLRKSGALGGYRWGAPRKRAMLAWESTAR